jgi:hypothetical protein
MAVEAILYPPDNDPTCLRIRGLLARIEAGEPIPQVFCGTEYPYFFWRLYANFLKWIDSGFESVAVAILAAQATHDLGLRGFNEIS